MNANNRAKPTRSERLTERMSPYWPHASLRTYLVIMILLATVPIAVLMGYQIFEQISTQREGMRDDLHRTVSVLAQSINRELESTVDALTILAFTSEIQRGEVDLFARTLFERPVPRNSWKGMYVLGLDGEVLIDTMHPGVENPMISRRFDMVDRLRQLAEKDAAISNLEQDATTGEFYTTVEVAVKVDGVARYVIGALIPVTAWQRLGKETGLVTPGITSIVDRNFIIISRSLNPEKQIGSPMPQDNKSTVQARSGGNTQFQSLEGGISIGAWERVPLSDWTALVGMPQAKVDAGHGQAIFFALATAISCLLLGVYLALLVARRLTVPLRQLARGEFHRASDRIPVGEIAQLRDALIAAQAQDEMNQDLLRRKRDLLQHKADEFETLLASIPVAVGFAQDPACERINHNAAMDAMFGSPGPKPGNQLSILENGVPVAREDLPLQRAAAVGEAARDRELEIRRAGQPTIFILCNAVPLRDADGKPRGAIAAALDITERKFSEERLIDAEQQLRESQRLVDLAQESGQVGFFHYQVDEDVLAWTPGQAKLFGLGADEVESLGEWTQRIERADWQRLVRVLRQAFDSGQERVTIEYRVNLPDDKSRWLSSRLRLMEGNSGQSRQVIGITVDMSEQKAAQSERDALIVREQAARIEAEAANRAKDEFLAMLGHELRNPLAAISSGVEVLGRTDGDSELAINARRIIARQTRHLAHMLDDLLDVARVMTGRVELERQPLDLGALVSRVMANYQISGEPSEHVMQAQADEVWVSANATRLEQVITNLLVNAIKYTPPGGKIALRVMRDGGDAVLEVADTGVGIEPALLPRVFDLFVQGDRSLDRRAGGMGVGLTLVRRLVELHGGTISAENIETVDRDATAGAPGEKRTGTLMRVRLPAITRPEIVTISDTLPAARQRCVAIVEDNEDALEGLSTLLKLEGHTVLTAAEGVSGLALILGRRPEVAVVDIGLPGMSGYEVARHSRAGGYPGKLIALTGYGQDNDKRAALAAGFDAHLLKPVSSKDLLRLIAED